MRLARAWLRLIMSQRAGFPARRLRLQDGSIALDLEVRWAPAAPAPVSPCTMRRCPASTGSAAPRPSRQQCAECCVCACLLPHACRLQNAEALAELASKENIATLAPWEEEEETDGSKSKQLR